VKHLVLFGEAAPLIERAVRGYGTRDKESEDLAPIPYAIHRCSTLEEAVKVAASVSQPGDIVLLSPGGTSFDAFRDFAERGRRFKELVRKLRAS